MNYVKGCYDAHYDYTDLSELKADVLQEENYASLGSSLKIINGVNRLKKSTKYQCVQITAANGGINQVSNNRSTYIQGYCLFLKVLRFYQQCGRDIDYKAYQDGYKKLIEPVLHLFRGTWRCQSLLWHQVRQPEKESSIFEQGHGAQEAQSLLLSDPYGKKFFK